MQGTQLNEAIMELACLLTENTKQVLTVPEVAKLTGMSERTIYKYCNDRKIPHYKSAGGKMTYFKRTEVESWMCHTRVATIEEIKDDAAKILMTNGI